MQTRLCLKKGAEGQTTVQKRKLQCLQIQKEQKIVEEMIR